MTDTGETMGLREAVARGVFFCLPKHKFVPNDQRERRWNPPPHNGHGDTPGDRSFAFVVADAILALPQLAAQQARIAELEAALEPFAVFAVEWCALFGDELPDSENITYGLTLGEFRRVRAALRKDPQQ